MIKDKKDESQMIKWDIVRNKKTNLSELVWLCLEEKSYILEYVENNILLNKK